MLGIVVYIYNKYLKTEKKIDMALMLFMRNILMSASVLKRIFVLLDSNASAIQTTNVSQLIGESCI